MAFVRKIKTKNGTYLAEVENFRENGKVKQKFIRYIGKEVDGKAIRKIATNNIHARSVKSSLDVLAIKKLADDLNITDIEQKESLSLVFAQLIDRKSISQLEEWFKKTEIPKILDIDITTKKLYNSLRKLNDISFEDIEEKIHQNFLKYEKENKAAVIDVTDTYFEGKGNNDKKRKGKDDKVRHLVQIGLAVSLDNGFPIFHNTYPGNLNDMQIMRDMISRLKEMEIKAILVDRGMISTQSLNALSELSCQVIAGIKKINTVNKKYISKIDREEIYSLKNRVKLVNTSVFIKSFKTAKGEIIVVYNPDLEVVKKNINFEKGIDNKESAIGYSVIFHNTNLSPKYVVKKYFEKDIVERAFKQLKGVLNIRSIRVWLKEHVRGHVRVCYLAYAILSLLQYRVKKLDITATKALDLLKDGYKIELYDKNSKFSWELTVDLQPKQKKILGAIGVVYKN